MTQLKFFVTLKSKLNKYYFKQLLLNILLRFVQSRKRREPLQDENTPLIT